MSNCITCGKGMPKTMIEVIEAYKKQRKDYWIYIKNRDYFLVNANKMKEVLKENKTKRGYKKGFEYVHIEEFKGY